MLVTMIGAPGRCVQREFDVDDFVGGIDNGRLENMNGGGRHAFVNENFAVVIFFTKKFQSHLVE